MPLYGFSRENGSIGFRNHVLVLPTVICAAKTARMIAERSGSQVAYNVHGCGHIGEDYEIAKRRLAGIGKNPNIAAVLVVALGCEKINGVELAEEIAITGKPVKLLSIQKDGGTVSTVDKGLQLVNEMKNAVSGQKRVPVGFDKLMIGVKCGGSDTFSGLIANPVAGIVADRVVSSGGTVLLGETTEFIGAEECLAARALNNDVACEIKEIVKRYESQIMGYGIDMRGTQPSRGNIEGGLTTIEEKSLGAIHKGGTSTIRQVVEYAQKPSEKGLIIMDGPSQDTVCNTGMIASGAQAILFTTGMGTPVGSPAAPVVKITGTPGTAARMPYNIDFSSERVALGETDIYEEGERLFRLMIAILNGDETCCAEKLGFDEFDFYRKSINP